MYKKLLGISIALSVMILFSSCEETVHYDVCNFDNGELYCYSGGTRYTIDLKYFALASSPEELVYNDSITLDDAVRSANDGFKAKRLDLLEVERLGNYEVRTYRFKGYFTVYITAWCHETYYRYLPFEYEAKEVWLNDKLVVKHPLVFENVDWEVTELPVSDEERNNNVDSKYQVLYNMNVYYGYDGDTIGNFDYTYIATRYDESVWYGGGGNITVTVTYDWHPED